MYMRSLLHVMFIRNYLTLLFTSVKTRTLPFCNDKLSISRDIIPQNIISAPADLFWPPYFFVTKVDILN